MEIMGIFFCSFIVLLLFPALACAATRPSVKMLSTPTCVVCTRMTRTLDELNKSYAAKIFAENVDIFEHRYLSRKHDVRYVPTLLFSDRSGNVFKKEVGYMSVEKILETFREAGIVIK
jgi:thioredoxin 1